MAILKHKKKRTLDSDQIAQILPHIPSGDIKGILMRLHSADLICKAGRTGNNACIWKKVR